MTNFGIGDLNAVLLAAQQAATSMREVAPNLAPATAISADNTNVINEPNVANVPSLSQMPSAEQIKQTMANLNIGSVLDKMSLDPEQTKAIMSASVNNMSPDMIEQARKLAQSGQSDRIMKEMQKRGMNPHAMKAEMEALRKVARNLQTKALGIMKKVVIITLNRQLKSRTIPAGSDETVVRSIMHCESPVEISCSRLALGPLFGKTIRVWYDATLKGKNKRASKIVGFAVAGDIIIHCENEDLTEEDFSAAELLLG